jgi:hypothetical protein
MTSDLVTTRCTIAAIEKAYNDSIDGDMNCALLEDIPELKQQLIKLKENYDYALRHRAHNLGNELARFELNLAIIYLKHKSIFDYYTSRGAYPIYLVSGDLAQCLVRLCKRMKYVNKNHTRTSVKLDMDLEHLSNLHMLQSHLLDSHVSESHVLKNN